MVYAESLIMLGFALGILKKSGMEREFINKFPEASGFREKAIYILDSMDIEKN